jgi:hypothetical protein
MDQYLQQHFMDQLSNHLLVMEATFYGPIKQSLIFSSIPPIISHQLLATFSSIPHPTKASFSIPHPT